MRITVDNLMHQLLNPQVNFEIARVVAERMGLVQMPSPHMTVKYHHAKTGISIVRSFLQKRWHLQDSCIISVTDSGAAGTGSIELVDSDGNELDYSSYSAEHVLSVWLQNTDQGRAFADSFAGFDLPALVREISARFSMGTAYDFFWWGGERLHESFSEIVLTTYARALQAMAKLIVYSLQHDSLTVRYSDAYPFDLGYYLGLYDLEAQGFRVEVTLTPSVLGTELPPKEYLFTCDDHVFKYVECVALDNLLNSYFTVTWGTRIDQRATHPFSNVLLSDNDFVKWLCSDLSETVALGLENRLHWQQQAHAAWRFACADDAGQARLHP